MAANSLPTSAIQVLPSGVYTLGTSVWVLIADVDKDTQARLLRELSRVLDSGTEAWSVLLECGHSLHTLPPDAAPAWLSLLTVKKTRVTKVAVVSRRGAISSSWTAALLADRAVQALQLKIFDKADEARAYLARRQGQP